MRYPVKKIYLIHGWAANRHIFNDLIKRLPSSWQVESLDLPGHGNTPTLAIFNIIDVADKLAEMIDDNAYVLGWSLGGLVALYMAARHPQKINALCLTASFAKFQATPDYPEGLSKPALAKMIALFQQDYPKHMRQFLQLQFLYAKDQHTTLEAVLPDILKQGVPVALEEALDAVNDSDARNLLPQISAPTLLIFGAKDSITPPRMGEYLHRHLPQSELHIIDKAAHAPFLSQASEFASLLSDFFERY